MAQECGNFSCGDLSLHAGRCVKIDSTGALPGACKPWACQIMLRLTWVGHIQVEPVQ